MKRYELKLNYERIIFIGRFLKLWFFNREIYLSLFEKWDNCCYLEMNLKGLGKGGLLVGYL